MQDLQLPELHPLAGFRLGTVSAGIKKNGNPDLVVMALPAGSRSAAVFTQNAFCAAPVLVAREHLAAMTPAYLIINSGNANAGTGMPGLAAARQCCAALAASIDVAPEAVLPFSTGVIGERLPVNDIVRALPQALANLSETGWADAATGIMTTDTVPKAVSRQADIGGQRVTVTGIAKGSGMIRPDMATMLAYIATDVAMDADALQQCLDRAVARSFNRITVDGDTSTNDACVLTATGSCGPGELAAGDPHFDGVCELVEEVCVELATSIVRDGEGATKFVTVAVEQGADDAECLAVAYAIAHSPLVKTALFASDPNWGRILAVVGRAGIDRLDINAVEIWLDEVCIVRDGGCAPDYTETAGQQVMSRDELTIRVVLGRGDASEQVWTCDLSYDYVKINAEYRT
ncbi:MAG: bifunctional glutamate N-acetyltransferase/amino-acid acetyltransferase ArgJ [Gammaproteobacteria bacterium]|nr:bifunctional glutamate N-acetyltransferase/amino-acid acetyltransferase ArgJ [Gammaproteobacteria bacterium]